MLKAFASCITYDLLRLDRGTRLADALTFFICDTIKIFPLLAVIIFIVSVIRSYFPLKKTKRIPSYKTHFISNRMAVKITAAGYFFNAIP